MLFKNLEKSNTATKYPSIFTYHELDGKGGLKENVLVKVDSSLKGYITEKVDGTNTRIILYKNDYIIGSREHMLHAKGDRILNPTLGIVENLIPVAEKLMSVDTGDDIVIVYGEVYGGNIGKGKVNYTSSNQVGYRVFDVARISKETMERIQAMPLDAISHWRENGGLGFMNVTEIENFCKQNGLYMVPSLCEVDISQLAQNVEGMYEFLKQYVNTQAGIDTCGMAEGLVVRSFDRTYIRKIRLEEYEKTLKKKK